MIADLAGRRSEAAAYYQQAETELGDLSPRTALDPGQLARSVR